MGFAKIGKFLAREVGLCSDHVSHHDTGIEKELSSKSKSSSTFIRNFKWESVFVILCVTRRTAAHIQF